MRVWLGVRARLSVRDRVRAGVGVSAVTERAEGQLRRHLVRARARARVRVRGRVRVKGER